MKLILCCVVVFALALIMDSVMGEECPNVAFENNFQYKRFGGRWNVIETTGLETRCAGFEAFETDDPNTFKINIKPVKLDVLLQQVDKGSFGRGFTEKSPLELMNNANLRVFATDYDNYAGVIECKNADGLFFVSLTILSRTGTLSADIVENLKQQLAVQGVDISGFKRVVQDGCF